MDAAVVGDDAPPRIYAPSKVVDLTCSSSIEADDLTSLHGRRREERTLPNNDESNNGIEVIPDVSRRKGKEEDAIPLNRRRDCTVRSVERETICGRETKEREGR